MLTSGRTIAGATTYFGIIAISFDNKTPASDATITLVNALGQVVYQSKENLTANVNTISVQTNDLKSGLYIVVLAIANSEYKQKMKDKLYQKFKVI